MNGLRVSLFGKFTVRYAERIVSVVNTRKTQALLGYLLLHQGRPVSRESVAGALWEDRAPAESRKCLRQTLWQLQVALSAEMARAEAPLLLVEPDWIQVNPDADVWLDVVRFEAAFEEVRSLRGESMTEAAVRGLEEAVQLYQGDLLEGCYEDWCLYERERLQNLLLGMLDRLMSQCEAGHRYEAGLVYGARILSYNPASERTHRRLMRLHYLAGDRTAALQQYDHCAAVLAEALSAKPGKRTVALYEQMRGDQSVTATSLSTESPPTDAPDAALGVVIGHLKQLQTSLAELQGQVQRAIQAAQRVVARRG